MSEIINLSPVNKNQSMSDYGVNLAELSNEILLDTRDSIENKTAVTMPIAQLATLGAGAASLLPAFRTVTQTTTIGMDGLYRLANKAIGDELKMAKNGNAWGAMKKAGGGSKMAQFSSVGDITATSKAVAAINPATLMMAAALYSIEQKLDTIVDMQKQILSFLEIEKESEIEADIQTLSSMMTKYKHNWDNEHYIASNHKLVLDIQRTARKNLNAYQKQVAEVISSKKLLVSQAKVDETLNNLIKKFKYYRLTMYAFSLASFVEVMLSGDFKEENILLVKDEIEKMSDTYRDYFNQGSVYLERLSNISIEANLLKGVGTASKAVGKFIDGIPKIRDGQVDEFLLKSGTKMRGSAEKMERKAIESFAEMSNPGVWVFVEKLNDMIQIYNHTESICFDENNIYLIAG